MKDEDAQASHFEREQGTQDELPSKLVKGERNCMTAETKFAVETAMAYIAEGWAQGNTNRVREVIEELYQENASLRAFSQKQQEKLRKITEGYAAITSPLATFREFEPPWVKTD